MTSYTSRILVAFIALLTVWVPRVASAQFDTATVLGVVTDQTGGAVPGATVTLTNPATGIRATTVSNSTGTYQFLNVRVGTYLIEAELDGFAKASVSEVGVSVLICCSESALWANRCR
jgi:hypothetical protein